MQSVKLASSGFFFSEWPKKACYLRVCSCQQSACLSFVRGPLVECEEVVEVRGLEDPALGRVFQDTVDQQLLEDLTVVNLFLDRAGR